ncbi:MAG: YifB family Mg chelatase-like AAA ATPase [Nitrospinae bacterium]|nr:YifB family Mg chelatase-like AAA ATPase [Nitrospinota bacterium]
MLSVVPTTSIIGIHAGLVEVEVDFSRGLPQFTIVGLPDLAVRESKERIVLAIKNAGYTFPMGRITVNLAPADIKKEGSSFDLPIAVGILAAANLIKGDGFNGIILGELSLDGSVKAVSGVLPSAILATKQKAKSILVADENGNEAASVPGITAYTIKHLSELSLFYSGDVRNEVHFSFPQAAYSSEMDFKYVKGQQNVKRSLEIAVAGGHNALMIGAPGSGKSLMAKTLPTIFPDLSFQEALETTQIYSVKGYTSKEKPIIVERPFRSPHHSISEVGLVGGGGNPMPGEISLSHNGVLFLDEITEFKRGLIDSLRQPLEDKNITISRARYSVTFPADFMMIAACNPCPCGNKNNPYKECHCTSLEIKRYMAKLSGPILDRIDIQVQVNPVKESDISGDSFDAESSAEIKSRVERAVKIQSDRFKNGTIYRNATMSDAQIKTICKLDKESKDLLVSAVKKFGLSARSYNRVLKVSRTIADLAESESIHKMHVAEAIQYRCIDSLH